MSVSLQNKKNTVKINRNINLRMADPYLSKEDQDRIANKINKAKWVFNTDFNLRDKPVDNFFKYKYDTMESIRAYNFRKVDKSKWVSPTNFMMH